MSATPGAALRMGFAGTPGFAAEILQALLHVELIPELVLTQPDRPTGRGRKLRASPVKMLAQSTGLALRQPGTLRAPEEHEAIHAAELDVLVVAAYGLLLPASILSIPRFGCINVHASLLPRWRGAAPIERAIMAGDSQTGVCIMQMEAGLDTGPVYLSKTCAIGPRTDGPALEAELARLGAQALLECLVALPGIAPRAQAAEGISYASKLTVADAVIHWSRPAVELDRQVRALTGRMPAVATAGADLRVRVLAARPSEDSDAPPGTILSASRAGIRVACGEGSLTLERLQLNRGKGNAIAAADAVNGYPQVFAPGCRLRDGAP